jgi:hypothetical protein
MLGEDDFITVSIDCGTAILFQYALLLESKEEYFLKLG